MVYLVRSATMLGAKIAEAVQWAVKVAAYLNKTYPDMNVRVLRNINGPRNQVHWTVRYESLAVLEQIGAKLSTDSGYQGLLSESQALFVEGSVVDNLYQTVE